MRNQIGPTVALALIIVCFTVAPSSVHAQCTSGTVCRCPECPSAKPVHRQGRWFILETANFQVCCERSEAAAKHLARHAETLRTTLSAKWLGNDAPARWNPKCQIILHLSRRSYNQAVGRGGERTVGSSSVKSSNGRIVARCIDLLEADTDFLKAALPHELTHVVVNDRFLTNPLPRWADEGIAILADPQTKQRRHQNDLHVAVLDGTTFHAAALLAIEEYPRPERFGAFYGQSASLTEFLVERESPAHFLAFMTCARRDGYDAALQQYYEIDGIGELDRQWRQHLEFVDSSHVGG